MERKTPFDVAAEDGELRAEVESLRAAVARVREACEGAHNDASGELVVYAAEVVRALDEEA